MCNVGRVQCGILSNVKCALIFPSKGEEVNARNRLLLFVLYKYDSNSIASVFIKALLLSTNGLDSFHMWTK